MSGFIKGVSPQRLRHEGRQPGDPEYRPPLREGDYVPLWQRNRKSSTEDMVDITNLGDQHD